jgi:hypothetical protein
MQDLIRNWSFTRIEAKILTKLLAEILRGIAHVEQLGEITRKC